MTVPDPWEDDADRALRAVIEGFVAGERGLFMPLALAYLHAARVSADRPDHPSPGGLPVAASAATAPLLDTMLGRFVVGRRAIAEHGALAAARVFCWVALPLLERLGHDVPQQVVQAWVTAGTDPAAGAGGSPSITLRAWPRTPAGLPIRRIESDAAMLALLRRHAMRHRRRRATSRPSSRTRP